MSIEIRLMQAADAPRVVDLYRAVYGDDYPVKSVYDPVAILAAQEAGDFYRILAFADDQLVGQSAIYRSGAPNPDLYESGQGIVLPAYRNQGVTDQLMRIGQDTVYPSIGIHQLWGEAVCNHVFMQKMITKLGWEATGIEIDLMPAAAYTKEKSSSGRVSTVVAFKVADPEMRIVHLPAAYAELLAWLYQPLNLPRRFVSGTPSLPADNATAVDERVFSDAAVARLTFTALGSDFSDCLQSREQAAVAQGCTVLQAFLDLGDPAVGAAATGLRGQGYFLGGLLPCWYGGDGLLLQKILHTPNIEGIHLDGERSHQILDRILADQAAVGPSAA